MLKKKTSSAEKKRKHAPCEDRLEPRKRRSTDYTVELESKDDLADAELDRIGSDIEEGGLDLTVQFQPITAFVSQKEEMLQQCFHVLGEKKLRKMLPDEFKDCSLDEIKKLCWEQLEQISEKNLLQILTGEELTPSQETSEELVESQQDNNVDSTSCLKESTKNEETKEVGGSSEESDVLSINADDSDIEAPKVEQTDKTADDSNKNTEPENPAVKPEPVTEQPLVVQPTEPKKDIQSAIDKSVSEILSFSAPAPVAPSVNQPQTTGAVQSTPPSVTEVVCQPSIQQLELLELEMRARAIKALMKANKKTTN
ncbi:caspase activity and apoptosis inhibitor 1 [Periophthalmus magnuspinnatus]|uniref:caspase activity and apoptosis inhibitor 1 n=1 Tax=Periophthalmus magnuspinnatus TaxID=409849 RepID=UPI00145B573F|nr:caspase activity and apoptosis inhibitor 1 [Periophthalmus magnuspinnatus]XP_055085006.1 caspase activity and apoptosis inhibitor 1 [Periophthalmus magnuspinnatus]